MKKVDLLNKIAQTQDGRLTNSDSGIDKVIVDAVESSSDVEDVQNYLKYAISELKRALAETEKHDGETPLDDKLGLTKLGDRNYALISRGVKSWGTYDPAEIFCFFEEHLYVDEASEIREFLQWCHDNDKHFGSGNYEERFREFKNSKKK
jgi:hypothetical protein